MGETAVGLQESAAHHVGVQRGNQFAHLRGVQQFGLHTAAAVHVHLGAPLFVLFVGRGQNQIPGLVQQEVEVQFTGQLLPAPQARRKQQRPLR
nr:hypothetical protein [Mycolicibacterium smegmatis]